MAKFLQETVEEIGVVANTKNPGAAKEFADLMHKVRLPAPYSQKWQIRSTGSLSAHEDIIRVARMFGDELTLDHLPRAQLVSMCKYLDIPAYGSDNFLRFQLYKRVRELQDEDAQIAKMGVDQLTLPELREACAIRGIRYEGESIAGLRKELSLWLDLNLKEQISPSLLLLTRAMSLRPTLSEVEAEKTKALAEDLATTLSALPRPMVSVRVYVI